jgi:hypothetical protein
MNPELKFRCLVTVEAEVDPQLPGRILDLLTVRGCLPEWFSVRKRAPDSIRVSLELIDVDDQAAELLARKILKLPTVLDVTRTWLKQRDQLAA